MRTRILVIAAALFVPGAVYGQQAAPAAEGGADDLAKQLANPVASLISLPLQSNWELEAGPEEDTRFVLNIQPVIPSGLTKDWTLITRVIVPVVSQVPLVPGGDASFGLSDVAASFFVTPAKPRGFIWGVGPVLQLPLTSDPSLGSEKWGAGPTILVLKQERRVTFGLLANQVWSFAGDAERADVNKTFIQPFLSFNFPGGRTIGLNAEATADWEAPDGEEWTVPVILSYSKVTKIGTRPASLALGAGYFVEKPEGGPSWKLRMVVTFLFPTKK